MASTIPNEINLLGFSGDILSLILETLKGQSFSGSIRIIKNIAVNNDMVFNPGFDLEITQIDQIEVRLHNVFFSVARPKAKKGVFESFANKLYINKEDFLTLIHPFSSIASTAIIGQGCYLEPGVVISPFAEIGFGVTINRNVSIGHHVCIGDFATINPGVHIAGHCQIGDGVSIGMGATIFDHITIGTGAVIGGGSVVTRNIPGSVLAYGNPCKVIKNLE